jgi:hypothetical protein
MTTGENKTFPVMGSRLKEFEGSDKPWEVFFDQMASWSYPLRIPNDNELAAQLKSMNFYNLGNSGVYPRLVLSMVEEHLTKSRPQWDDDNLQLEHIMPQTLNEAWRIELGPGADSIHQELLHNPGNITLIRHNQELGNKPFKDKKATYAGKSGLQVAQNFVTECERWDAEAIHRRQEYLSSIIREEVLTLPASRKHANNWTQQSDRQSQYDIKAILNQLVGENIYFVEDQRIVATVQDDSVVLFEGKEWKLSPLTTHIKNTRGKVSPNSQFNGANYWVWGDTRLIDLEL